MGRPEQVAARTLEGLTPQEIAADLGLSFNSVLAYLARAVGERSLRRSDVLFTLSPKSRQSPTTYEDREVVRRFGDAPLGDLYEDLRVLETTLHERIRSALEHHHGSGEMNWWTQGVPQRIREECSQRRERDPKRLDSYCYTDLLHLREILEANWSVLQAEVGRLGSDRKELHEMLGRVNEIRNMVMHPARGIDPNEEDFAFIRSVNRDLRV